MESNELTFLLRKMECDRIEKDWMFYGGWALFDKFGCCLCYRTDSDKTLQDKLKCGMGERIEYRKPFDPTKRPDKYDRRAVNEIKRLSENIKKATPQDKKLLDNLYGLYSLTLHASDIIARVLIRECEAQKTYVDKEVKRHISQRMEHVKVIQAMQQRDEDMMLKQFGDDGSKYDCYQIWANMIARTCAYIFDITGTDEDKFAPLEKYLRQQCVKAKCSIFPVKFIDDNFRLR